MLPTEEAATMYWKSVLADCQAISFPSLPPNVQELVSDATVTFQCSPLTKQSSDITVSTLIHGAWAILASCYTNSDDVVFGATMNGRNAPVAGIEAMAGPTIATVPVRVHVRDGHKVTDFLHDLQQQGVQRIEFEQTGLHDIAKVSPDAQHACGFQTLLAVQPELGNVTGGTLGHWSSRSELQGFTTYALMLQFQLDTNGIQIVASFDPRAIEQWQVEKMLHQFNFVMQQLAGAEAETVIANIETLTPDDRQQLWEWNKDVPPAVERCVHDLFTDQAKARPDAPAICSWDGEMTYGELDRTSSKLAGHLSELGVGPEEIVPLCFEKSMWTIVAMLAVLKAGGAFLLLDPSIPKERLRLMCSKVSANLALSSAGTGPAIEGLVRTVLTINSDFIFKLPQNTTKAVNVEPRNTAYIIFTSGSTGEPKGCRMEHRAACSSAVGNSHNLEVHGNTRALQFSSYSFAGSVVELLINLTHGGCICVLSEEQRRTDIASAMRQLKVNWAFLTPTALGLLDSELVPSMEVICVGGEPMRTTHIARWEARVHMYQTYGCSEISLVLAKRLSSYSTSKDIGQPRMAACWVVDPSDDNKLVPIGAVGELIVEGAMIGREYIAEPHKSSAAFINSPKWRACFGGRTISHRFYKTGDLGRYRNDGSLEIIGRKDNQIKLRGQRIELGEIEHQARLAKSSVKEIVVEIIQPKGKEENILACFVVDDSNESQDAMYEYKRHTVETEKAVQIIQDRLEAFLPQYMLPSAYIPLSCIPETWSRKIDRKRLREIGSLMTIQQLAELRTQSHGPKRQPTSEAEKTMQQLWSHVLGLEPNSIGLDDSFFRLGGDSIAAMKLVGEARRLGMQLAVADVFRNPKLEALAKLDLSLNGSTNEDIPAFSLLGEDVNAVVLREEVAQSCNTNANLIEDIYLCSPLQSGLIALTSKRSGDYIMQSILELPADIDEVRFRAAWEYVVQITPVLRTRIVQNGKMGLLQAVMKEDIEWIEAEELEGYLSKDKSVSMGLCDPLTRYAIISNIESKKRWMVWTIHHALYDGWSLPRILDAVKKTYNGATIEKQPGYNAFIKYLSQQDQEAATMYWKSVLADCQAISFPSLPPNVQELVSDATVTFQCSPLTKQSSDITVSTLIHGAWAILASCYTNSDDVVFGATMNGRNAPVAGIEAMAGPTIATVPVRVHVRDGHKVTDFLHDLQQQGVQRIEFEQTGLHDIAKVSPDAQHACGFQTLLIVQPELGNVTGGTLGHWSSRSELQGFTTYALMLQFQLDTNGIQIVASFDPRAIEQWQVEKMLHQFNFVMQQLAGAEAETVIANIETLTPDDRQQLWEWNKDVPPAVERCVHDLFTDQAKARPDAPAICSWDGEMTYGELDRTSSKLAGHLSELGVGPEEIVPLCFEKSMWTIVAMLAVLKAGGAFVPLDPGHPRDRLHEILHQTGAKIILTSEQESSQWNEDTRTVIVLQGAFMQKLSSKPGGHNKAVDPVNMAYVLFTSGSTGKPKGVMIEHKALSTSCLGHGRAFGMSTHTRALQFTAYTADISITEIITTLLHGGCVCVPSDNDRRNNIEHAIQKLRANLAYLTPTVARLLEPSSIPTLKVLLLGGEPVTAEECQKWNGNVSLINTYGPTECSIASSAFFGFEGFKAGMIGKSIASLGWVVSPGNVHKLVPIGSVGELVIEGSILARGYIGDEEKTRSSFINDPKWLLGGSDGQLGRQGRVYKTGDLVYNDRDGNFICVGRKDNQVKVRGQRVELGEIEHHLRACVPEAKSIAVEQTVPRAAGAKPILVAFLEQYNGRFSTLSASGECIERLRAQAIFPVDLEEKLAGQLPNYMLPDAYFLIPRIPITASGKIDRRGLKDIAATLSLQQLAELRTQSHGPKRQPTSEAEKTMQQLWSHVLGLEPNSIGLDDSFFRLGGDSIAAMKLVGEARRLGMQLTVADVFRNPKLEALAKLDLSLNGSTNEDIPAFSLLGEDVNAVVLREEVAQSCNTNANLIEDIYLCSPLQSGLIALTSKRSGDYIMQSILELPADIDEVRFRAAWEYVVQITPVLRTRIVQNGKMGLLQAVMKEDIEWIEAEELEGYLSKDKSVSMGLCDPLTRYAIISNIESKKRWMVWTIHHALYDGWSLPRILDAVKKTYNGATIEKQPGYNAFIKYLSQQDQEAATMYWKSVLADCQAISFPSLPPNVQELVSDATVTFQCSPLTKQSSDITVSTLIHGAWAILASCYTNSDDVVFGATMNGRNAPVAGIEAMAGPTIATVPVRVHVRDGHKVTDFLHDLQQQGVQRIEFEQTGLHDIAKVSPDAQHACGFQTLLAVQPELGNVTGGTLGHWSSRSELQGFTTYALMLQFQLDTNGIQIVASFDPRAIEQWQVEKMLHQFNFVMQQLAGAEAETVIANIETLTPDDRQQLWEWNKDVPPAVERCVHDLFTDQAKARPDAPAICSWDGEMTYGELDRTSSKLAGHLSELGVGPEEIVPLCFEKSMWTIVAMLAVLKAGGAFLLLDPSIPKERLRLMCSKVSANLALSSAGTGPAIEGLVRTVLTINSDFIFKLPQNTTKAVNVEPRNTAYIIFTSGSTGEPKGCRMEHRAACSFATRHGHSLGLCGNTRALQFSSYSFAGSVVELILNLSHGGCLCVLSEEQRRTDIASAMRQLKVNWAFLTSTVIDLLTPQSQPHLAVLCVCGDAIRASQLELWEQHVNLRQTYGSSETVGPVSSTSLSHTSTTKDVGRAITGVFWIVNPNNHNKLVPIGSIGEVLVEGPILGRDYIAEPHKTVRAFIEAPAWRTHFEQKGISTRLYKTGDLARYKRDGSIQLIGRKDNQVKLRGQRIELGEIEHQVRMANSGLKEVVVELIKANDAKESLLACFVVFGDNTGIQMTENDSDIIHHTYKQHQIQRVQDRLERFLPQYMVPSAFIEMDSIPLLWSRKINRKELRRIGCSFSAQQLAEMQKRFQGLKRQPTSEAEKTMQQLWSHVLGLEPNSIGLDDSFFRLGGDSIAAMKLVGEARRLGMQLAVADVFRNPNLDQFASVVSTSSKGSTTGIPRTDYNGPVVQSFAQSGLWFLEELYPGLNWYLIPLVVSVKGPLQLDALQSALLAVEHRHETLRTTFDTIDGVGVQIVRPLRSKALNVVNIHPGEQQRLADAVREDQTTPFNLRTDPGWRVTVYRMDDNDHLLSIVMHHIISDGWSLDVLTRELATFYSASVRGEDPLLQVQPLSVQYRDFSMWQKEPTQVQKHQDQLDYWLTQLQGSRAAELLCDKPRPATLSGKAAVKTIDINGLLYLRLQHFCKLYGTTQFVVLLAAFRATHFRLSGQEDATIGAVNASRDRWELKDMIGFFVNLQCLRITLHDDTFVDLVKQVHEVVVSSHANADVPFENIVSKLKNDRDLSRHPLVQLVFAVHAQRDLGQLKLEGVETETIAESATTRFDLEFHFHQKKDGLQGSVVFSTDLYTPETIENMLSVFCSVLETCLEDPKASVASLPLLTKSSFDKLDSMGLLTIEKTAYPRDSNIADLFREQASFYPSRIAVKDLLTEMTYEQLDKASDTLAWWLTKRSFKSETIIGVFANRSCETVVAFLGILKAGLAYLPFDVKTPAERIEGILSFLPSHFLLFVGTGVQPPDIQLSTVERVRIAEVLTEATKNNFASQISTISLPRTLPTNLAYVMFTSGSTGQPKGVMVEHRSVVRLAKDNNVVQYMPTSPVMAHMSNHAFDGSTWEVYACLLRGGTLICIDTADVLDPEAILQQFDRHHVVAAFMTPTLMTTYFQQVPSLFSELDLLCVGGETLHPADVRSVGEVIKGKLLNGYGPTENTTWSTIFLTSKEDNYANGVPIGYPHSNSGAYVMDSKLQLVPLGVIGELVVTGDGVARGYIDPKRNIDRFVTVDVAGQKQWAYRTGDYARWRPVDGQLEFFGRMDSQVKIRGNRVEMGEIEHVLRKHKSVSEAVIVLQHSEDDDTRLAAFVTVNKGILTDQSTNHRFVQKIRQELLRMVEQQLPAYMVPKSITILKEMPMNQNGKVDRQALIQHVENQVGAEEEEKRQPTSEAEKTMQQLWSHVLGLEPNSIGLDDSFFRLGGDSIAAMKLVGEARRLGMQLAVADVFRNPNLDQFASVVSTSSKGSTTGIPRTDYNGPVVQSFAQSGLWFLEELYPGLNWYLIPLVVSVKGPLQLDALQSALLAVEHRHETLRTTFDTIDGVGVQIVRPLRSKALNVVNIHPGEQQRLADAVREDQTTPFNLRTDPGWRVTVYRMDDNDHLLSIVMHHIISDGWSLDVLTRELATFYSASVRGEDPLLQVQPLSVQYRDFSMWQKEPTQVQKHQDQLDYWLTQLQGSRAAELLCDKPRPATLSGKAAVKTIDINGLLYLRLQHFCKLYGTTQFVVLLAAFRATHFRLSGQEDATIGAVNASRDRWELKDMIGFFVNLQCLRITLHDDTFVDLVKQVHEVVVSSHANADVPFENIVSKLKNDRDLSRHPLVQLVFAVHAQRDLGQLKLEGVETETIAESATTRFDLEFHFHQKKDGLQGSVVFSTDLYTPETIENMLSVFCSVLETCLEDPKASVASLPLLTKSSFDKLDSMGLLTIEKTAYPRDSNIADLFREQASFYPSRIAVKDLLTEMTYEQLDKASDTLAWWLTKRSFKSETIIGVFANRSCETVVAFLGILKAGLAYLPFDVKTPAERIEGILSFLPSHFLLFVGTGVQPPDIQLSTVERVRIAEVLTEATKNNFASQISTISLPRTLPTNLAYVMFTSGSTGQPKGVMVEHRSVVRLAKDNNVVQYMPTSPVMAHIITLAFDGSTWEIYTCLLRGGTLICIDTADVLDPEAILRIFQLHRVNMAIMPTKLMTTYFQQVPSLFSELDLLCVGGETLHPADVRSVGEVIKGKLLNGYGPTENTTTSTVFLTSKEDNYANGVPIGYPHSNSGAYVMDSKLQLVPLGVIGELVVTGDGLARGYIDPKRNIDRFVTVDVAGQKQRAYRTGDYARWRPVDGQLEFFGRMDSQVKIRGNRVEMGEIEHVLRKHKSVSEAVIVLQHSEDDDTRLAAFVTVNKGILTDQSTNHRFVQKIRQELLRMVEQQLPAYMVPKSITILKEMPMNQNGKVDRQALIQHVENQVGAEEEEKRQPTSEAEKTMQQLWSHVLGLEPNSIGLDDSFFRLGGDSIAAMKLVGEARRLGMQLAVADVFRNPKLEALAKLDLSLNGSTNEDIPAFSLLGEDVNAVVLREEVAQSCNTNANLIEDIYLCSPLQSGLIALTSKRSGDYIMQSILELPADIDEVRFRAAWEYVVQITPVLRTRIVQNGKMGLLQAVMKEDIEWIEAEELEGYLSKDKSVSMGLCDPLTRYAIISNIESKKRWMVWTIHHALYDGWSLPRILDAVKKTYNGATIEKQPGYNAFIKYLSQQDQEAATMYWKSVLADCQAISFPSLPPNVQELVSDATVTFQCSPLTKQSSDITVSTLIHGAWAILASCYTNSDDVVFGATMNGRNAPVAGIEAMAGPTIATVPVRVHVRDGHKVTDFLHDLQQQGVQRIEFEQTGLHDIAKVSPDAQHACGFQTLLAVQPELGNVTGGTLGHWSSRSELQGFTTYALMLQFQLDTNGIQIVASFDPRAIEQWQVEKMLHQFNFVMQQLAGAEAETVIANIETLTPDDRQQLWEWNKDVPPAVERCVHDLFTDQAKARPDAPAICSWDGEMTYGELDRTSSKLAGHLSELGVGPEEIVPLCFEKSMWTIVAMLAVLKAGGAFVPLDPGHPRDRLHEILHQTGAKIILTSEQESSQWNEDTRTVIVLQGAFMQKLSSKPGGHNKAVDPVNMAYVLFTSGSTGKPKGVMIEHKALSTSCLGHGRAFGMSTHTRALQFTAYTADISIMEIVTTLLHGGCVCVPSDNDRRNNIEHAIQKLRANSAYLTPTVARLLEPSSIPTLKVLLLGGEPVTAEECQKWNGNVSLINGYGPTECSIASSAFFGFEGFKAGMIGKSIASLGWVVSPGNVHKLVPIGSVGELVIEGSILARGYIGDEEKTRSSFINDPKWLLGGSDGQLGRQGRVYKTGDLVYNDRDGNFICVGRKDNQVKVRGQRVELGEIEHHLRACVPEAKSIAVEQTVPRAAGAKPILVAFLEQYNGRFSTLSASGECIERLRAQAIFPVDLEEKLAGRLRNHVLPDAYFLIPRIPITASGKIDRRGLKDIAATLSLQQLAELRTQSHGPKRQPTSEAEKTMQQLWSHVLGLEPNSIGLDDSFFRLGGDSIAAMKLVGEARQKDVQLTVADVFNYRTIKLQARVLKPRVHTKQSVTPFSLIPPSVAKTIRQASHLFHTGIRTSKVVDILPTNFEQRYFVLRGVSDPRVAFNYIAINLGPELDEDLLRNSCFRLVEHFPILRTVFMPSKEKVWQIVLHGIEIPFDTMTIHGSTEQAFEGICMRTIEQTDPLELPTSFLLLRNKCRDNRLIIRLSHSQYDGISLPVVLKTLGAIYEHQPLGPSVSLASYIAHSQRRRATSSDYWRELLQDSKITRVISKIHLEAPKQTDSHMVKAELLIDHPVLPETLTMASLFTSAWAMVLSNLTGDDDVVFGQLVTGRNADIPGIEEMVGCCVNVVPIRAVISSFRSPEDFIHSVQEQYLAMGDADSMDWDDIVQNCTTWPKGSIFDVGLQYQGFDETPEIQFAGKTDKVQWLDNPFIAPSHWTIYGQPKNNRLQIVISGGNHILTSETAHSLAVMLGDMIIALSTNLQSPLASDRFLGARTLCYK